MARTRRKQKKQRRRRQQKKQRRRRNDAAQRRRRRRRRGHVAPILLLTSAGAGQTFTTANPTRSAADATNRPDYKVPHTIQAAECIGKRGFKPDWLSAEISPITFHSNNPSFTCQGNKITSVSTAGDTLTGPAINAGTFEVGMVIVELNNYAVNPHDPSTLAQLNQRDRWMTIKAVRIPPGYRVDWDPSANRVYYVNDNTKSTSYNPPPQNAAGTGSGTVPDDDEDDGVTPAQPHETTIWVHVNYVENQPRLEMIDGNTVRLYGYPSMTVQMLKYIVEDTLNDCFQHDGEDVAIQAVAKDDFVLPDAMVCLNAIPEGSKLEMYGIFGPRNEPIECCTIS